jgi:hypothetical protein
MTVVEDLLRRLQQRHEHLPVAVWTGSASWWFYFIISLCFTVIPLILGFLNPCITFTSVYYPLLTSLYGGGLLALVLHILTYDTKACFCTSTHAHNHMLEVTTVMALRGAWWSAIQLYTLDLELWWALPVGIGYMLEFFYYFPALWGRHIRYCVMNDKGHVEFSSTLRAWMIFLDILWFTTQLGFVLTAIYFNDELSSGRPVECL